MNNNLNDYGDGRLSVINEMITWCDNEIWKIKKHGMDSNSHNSASMSGQVKAYSKVKEKLKVKRNNLKTIC